MAEIVVSSVLGTLANLIIEESFFLYGVRDEVEWLYAELRSMQAFLINAEVKKRRGGSEWIKRWLKEVREVAYQAEDIILQVESNKTQKKRYAAFPSELISRHKLRTEIKALKNHIDHIKKGITDYALDASSAADAASSSAADAAAASAAASVAADNAIQARRSSNPHLDDSTRVVGLEDRAKEIEDRLLNPNIKSRCVLSIVGMGGIGKTTLASKVYSEIKVQFDISAWISLSQDYNDQEIHKELISQMMGKSMDQLQSYTIDEMSEMLREFLMQRRYLVVLDDVWSTDVWDHLLRKALPDVNNGSWVLLTTRLQDLATSIDSFIYQLSFLNDDESWALFLGRAFPDQKFSEPMKIPEELEGIGRQLVNKCKGLPLALKVLGGILSTKTPNFDEWTSVANNLDLDFTNEGDLNSIVRLNYDKLPHHHLKSCFLYLGVFPENSVIKAKELIELWIAENFIPYRERQLMEDTAHAYLEELARSLLVQVVGKDWLGSSASVSTFRIHDIFRHFCIREASENNFFTIYDTSNSTHSLQYITKHHGKNLRRLVVHDDISTANSPKIFLTSRYSPNLRSILHFGKQNKTAAIIMPDELKHLRVIHFVNIDNSYEKFPGMLDKMIMNKRDLRYLRLSGNCNIPFLPPCIQNLCNLQTLELVGNESPWLFPVSSLLPDWFGKISTLRHLYLQRFVSIPAGIGSLPDLQTLDAAISTRAGWIESGLRKLVNIRILMVEFLAEEQGGVFVDSLRQMKHLSSLKVQRAEVIPMEIFSVLSSEHTQLRSMSLWGPMSLPQLPAGFGFPPNLTTLVLMGSKLAQDPMPTLEKLPYLRELELYKSYSGKEMICTSGGFPELRELRLWYLDELEEWRVEDGAMPNLTNLHINKCRKLTIPDGLQHLYTIPKLRPDGLQHFQSFQKRT